MGGGYSDENYDHKIVLKFIKEHIFLVLEYLVQLLVMVDSIFVIDLLKIC